MKKYRVHLELECDYENIEAPNAEMAIDQAIEWFQDCEPHASVEIMGAIQMPTYIPMTDEIYTIVTQCPRLYEDNTTEECQLHCPLWRVCQDYWGGNTIE